MPRILLNSGAYQARSIIANAQRCVNLYPEGNPKDSPVPMTHYCTPGLTEYIAAPFEAGVRCIYRASNGAGYAVIGNRVYAVNPDLTVNLLGYINTGTNPVSMSDNGLAVVIVDGSPQGWAIDLAGPNTFGIIYGDGFYGADRVDVLDTYFLFNKPGTGQFYISLSNVDFTLLTTGVGFDPLDFASKEGFPDPIVGVVASYRQIWLIGALYTEVWFDSGAEDFPFQVQPGAYIEHGCVAKYSIAKADLSVYWLSQDLQGHLIVMQGAGYIANRISTHAIENEFMTYGVVSDAIGFTYQQEGHLFYVLTFPTANKTWVYDRTTQLWHQRTWTDSDGGLNRSRVNCAAYLFDKNIVGDFENGTLYEWDLNAYTDVGNPISRIRSFPQIVDDAKRGNNRRIVHRQFIADMDVGEIETQWSEDPPTVSLRWSDDKGASWSNRMEQSLGGAGQYLTNVQFRRLGLSRDRVYELSWSMPAKTALNGAWLDIEMAAT